MAIKHKRINHFYLSFSLWLLNWLYRLLGKKSASKICPRPIITDSNIRLITDEKRSSPIIQDNIIYTYILGAYDNLKEPTKVSHGWRYYCYTDQNIESKTWQQRPVPSFLNNIQDNKRRASLLKIGHKNLFDASVQFVVSMDGSMVLNFDMNQFLDQHWDDNYDLMLVKHPLRTCLYDEAVKVIEYKFDYPSKVIKQMTRYLLNGYPINYGLNSSGFMIKNNQSDGLRHLSELWADQYQKGSVRDQLSLNYAMWLAEKENCALKIKEIDFNWLYKTSGYIQIQEHKL